MSILLIYFTPLDFHGRILIALCNPHCHKVQTDGKNEKDIYNRCFTISVSYCGEHCCVERSTFLKSAFVSIKVGLCQICAKCFDSLSSSNKHLLIIKSANYYMNTCRSLLIVPSIYS